MQATEGEAISNYIHNENTHFHLINQLLPGIRNKNIPFCATHVTIHRLFSEFQLCQQDSEWGYFCQSWYEQQRSDWDKTSQVNKQENTRLA